ncbi:hypothetical protein WER83_07040 [Staphylococcus felis]|uniref:hypothetical protein n=1 Tax=Staphylococcus felis TaxID=46127 RepID=UPI003967BC07
MRRDDLRQFKNRNVIASGIVACVCFKNRLYIEDNWKRNVKILLKNVVISGVEVDHVWLFERNKYYDMSQELIGQEVKFKAKVTPYMKQKEGVFIEDYGIERSSKLLLKEVYERENELAHAQKY